MTTFKGKQITKIQTRINPEVKKNAEAVLSCLGINLNDAVRMFLNQVVIDGGLPFRPQISHQPNEETIAAIDEVRAGKHSRAFNSVEELMADLEA